MMCSASRYVLLAWFAGLLGTTATGNDGLGWAAAGVTVAVAYGLARRFPARFGGGSCALPERPRDTTTSAPVAAGSSVAPDPEVEAQR